MESISHFHSLDELILALDRERKLIRALFQDRKKLSFRYELARELASRKEESLDFLIRYGVLRENVDTVELQEVYLKFFEEVLEVNEHINLASVKEYIDSLNNEIDYYLNEKNPNRKLGYLKNVKRILRNIGLDTYRNVIDLKRNIHNTYKNEPSFEIKKKKLVHLDEKRQGIASLIQSCERLIEDRQATFFLLAMDVELNTIVTDLRLRFRDSFHNLFDLDKQIIAYLNLIEYQSKLFEKVQKVKYLRDQLLLETNTDIQTLLASKCPVWMEPRPQYQLKISLSNLRNTDEGLALLRAVSRLRGAGSLKRDRLVEPLTEEELRTETREIPFVDVSEVKDAFLASGDHLFHFVMNYSQYSKPMDEEDKLVLFCQIATQFLDELTILPEFGWYGDIEYPIIVSK